MAFLQRRSLKALTKLRKLVLTSNNFSSALPACVSELTSLEELYLRYCSLTDLPPNLKYLTKLTKLRLVSNNFSSGLPACVSELTSLEELDLRSCSLTDLPPNLKALTKLTKLRLGRNNFSSGLPACVSELTSLEELDLSDCSLADLPPNLKSLTRLKQLDLSSNDFSSGLPACVPELTSLEVLNLSYCSLADLPPNLGNLQNLNTIDLSMNSFTSLPPDVCQLNKLRVLKLGNNNTLKTLDSGLLQLENLIEIDCYNCQALTSPPYAVCRQGVTAIKKYYRDLNTAESQELPVIMAAVMGNTMSGKTSLIKSVQNSKRELTNRTETSELDETTKVFAMKTLQLQKSRLKCVDFGGQNIYHMAYQMALKSDCIPLIVVNMEEYADISSLSTPMKACKRVCFDWMSHFYLACPRLGHPLLVLTHKDKFPNEERFQMLVTELLGGVEACRLDLLEEEKELFGDSSDFCHILHLCETDKPVFHKDDIFAFGTDLNDVSNIHALRASLDAYCQRFSVPIPLTWEQMGKYFDDKRDKPLLQLSEIQKEFPDEEQLIILRYMHNIGRVLWYEREPTLNQYVFHQISELTNMVSLLFHHSRGKEWNQRVAKFRPFRYPKKLIQKDKCREPVNELIHKDKYQALVAEFMESGIIDEVILFNIFDKESNFPADVALAVLCAFYLLHGPVSHNSRKLYMIPSYCTENKDGSFVGDGDLQLKISIAFKGLPLPEYVYQLFTVALLNMYTDTTTYKYAAKNGATVQHGESTTHLVHNLSERLVTVQVSTSVEELSASWQRLLETCSCILNKATTVWKATRYTVKLYCTHCLFMRDRSSGYETDPDWVNFATQDTQLFKFSFVKCFKDKSRRSRATIPTPLEYPCKEVTNAELIQEYLNKIVTSRFPPYAEKEVQGTVIGSNPSLAVTGCTQSSTATSSTQSSTATSSTHSPHGSSLAGPISAVSRQQDSDSELSDDLEYLGSTDKSVDEIRLRVTPCRKTRIRDLFTSDSVYKMSGPIRGRCLILNNMSFDHPASSDQIAFGTREGSQMDVKNISKVFKVLSFEIGEICSDLTSQEMVNAVQEETRHRNHTKYGMFVLVIMTHGSENKVYGKDGRAVSHSTLYDRLSPYNFPAMAGKPKVVIVQACSGNRVDSMGIIVPDGPTSGNIPEGAASALPPSDPAVARPLPWEYLSTDDLFIMKASFLSYVSSRNTRNGSWFIRALVEALYKHACHRDIQSVFQQVKKKVRAMSLKTPDVSGQQPTDECTFTKGRKLYLFPDYNPRV